LADNFRTQIEENNVSAKVITLKIKSLKDFNGRSKIAAVFYRLLRLIIESKKELLYQERMKAPW
jgi:hypothetical protein